MTRKLTFTRCIGSALAAIWMLALSSCGFTPLYAAHSDNASSQVVDALAKVIIRPLPDRSGMKLRQVLREQLQPQGLAANPTYELEITLTTRVQELGIQKDATSSRANLIMSASFYLIEGGKRTFADRAISTVGYNILNDQYATVQAQADAENRAIQEVSGEIKTRLAVYFEQHIKPKQAAQATP